MVTLMQCIHDTVYTLAHCYATLSLSQFLQLKKKKNIKKRIYNFDRKKRISDCTAKNSLI